MGHKIALTSADGFGLSAYEAPAREARRGGLVILHAIWGVTPHLRDLADQMAERGYETLVPSLMDRDDPGFPDQDTDPTRLARRLALGEASGWGANAIPDVQAAINKLSPPVFLIGFCFGGTAAWLASARCTGLTAVSSFYGGHVHQYRHESPRCSTILHFGRDDASIPLDDVVDIAAAHPDMPIWLYDAGHAFVAPSGYHESSANLAILRTLQHFQRTAGRRGEI